MKKALIFLSFSWISICFSQTDSLTHYKEILERFESDSLDSYGIALDEVILFQPLRFSSMKDLKAYLILRNRTLRVYPYAKLAGDRLDSLTLRMERIHNKRKRNLYLKRIEKFIYDEFEEELKKLSRSQGRILIKLVHRQTGATTHELVKELRNGWRAFFYQTTASLFDLTLKAEYQPETIYEDFLIEDILQRAAADKLIELDATALEYNLDSLYPLWKAKKKRIEFD